MKLYCKTSGQEIIKGQTRSYGHNIKVIIDDFNTNRNAVEVHTPPRKGHGQGRQMTLTPDKLNAEFK